MTESTVEQYEKKTFSQMAAAFVAADNEYQRALKKRDELAQQLEVADAALAKLAAARDRAEKETRAA